MEKMAAETCSLRRESRQFPSLQQMEVVLREKYGTNGPETIYVKPKDQDKLVPVDTRSARTRVWQDVGQSLRSVFLPQGYPDSVSDDYLTYQLWDTVQAFASSITGALATQAVLKGVGVGDANATPLAATMTWLLKDGTGMIGRIVFAWWKGSALDSDCKKWRLFADILNDMAICLELLAPLLPVGFTLTLCMSSIWKAVVGVAGSATRAALTQHQARRNNMADVSAKDGSQETLVNLAALVTSLVLLPAVGGKMVLTWILFILFTALHLFANYRAVSSVWLETLNRNRLHVVLAAFLDRGKVPGIVEANTRESVLLGTGIRDVHLCGWTIILGGSLRRAVVQGNLQASYLDQLTSSCRSGRYLLWPVWLGHQRQIQVLLHHLATAEDQLQAYFHAVVLGRNLCNEECQISEVKPESLSATSNVVDRDFPIFLQQLKSKGWVTSRTLLAAKEWRVSWGVEEAEETPPAQTEF